MQAKALLGNSRSKAVNLGWSVVANSSDSTHHIPKVCSYPGILPKFAVNDGGLTRGIYTTNAVSSMVWR